MYSRQFNLDLCVILSFLILLYDNTGVSSVRKHRSHKNHTEYLIKTDGCVIPNQVRLYKKGYTNVEQKVRCKPRIVYIDKTYGDQFQFRIDEEAKRILEAKYFQHLPSMFFCVYRILALASGQALTDIRTLKNGDTLDIDEDSIVVVTCAYLPKDLQHLQNSSSLKVYKDAFVLFRKTEFLSQMQHRLRWNVLVLGFESMSRSRVQLTMPNLVQYMNKLGWLEFRAHHSVSKNMFHNIRVMLTGSNQASRKQDYLWGDFALFEFVTAMGHDITSKSKIRDEFEKMYQAQTTDHLFRLKPWLMKYAPQCFGRLPVTEHLFDYATQFVQAYKSNDNFFGFFYISAEGSTYQSSLMNFLEKLRREGAMRNTFVVLFGNGSEPISLNSEEESFDAKLPMMYMWVPIEFRKMYPKQYQNMKENQYRLTNNYDMYATFRTILQFSEPVVSVGTERECRTCVSLFKKVPHGRTCSLAQVDSDQCACQRKSQLSEEMKVLQKIIAALDSQTEIPMITDKRRVELDTWFSEP